MVSIANDLKSTDPRDKIYAIAPLASEVASEELDPDYSLPPERVYPTFTKLFIQKAKSLQLLSLCRNFHLLEGERPQVDIRPIENLPSWCPDYRSLPSLQICELSEVREFFSADGGQEAKILSKSTPMSLYVEGVVLATVVVGGGLPTKEYWAQKWDFLKTRGFLPTKVQQVSTTDDLDALKERHITLERYWRTLSASFIPDAEHIEVFAQMILETDAGSHLKLSWSEDHFLRKHNTAAYSPAQLQHQWTAHTTAVLDNSLIVTHDGRLGLGPKMTKFGDIVVILSGSCVPFVLREKNLPRNATRAECIHWLKHGPVYQLIGECYVDGKMHGEIFDDPLFEDPLHIDPLDHDNIFYSNLVGKNKTSRGRKGVYRKKFFHLQ
jgi:hypothetical protein